MGIAHYNQGSNSISSAIDRASTAVEFDVIDQLNAIPKIPDAGTPFGPIQFLASNGQFWEECLAIVFGFPHARLREAVSPWRVQVVSYNNVMWLAEPIAQKQIA